MPRTLILLLLAASAAAPQEHAVIDAVHKGHAVGHEQDGVDAVRAALKAGGDVNERDQNGWTPLMHAALECRAQIAGLLLERGADAKLRANTGHLPDFVDSGLTAILFILVGRTIAFRGPPPSGALADDINRSSAPLEHP